jgi:hypothetical protein
MSPFPYIFIVSLNLLLPLSSSFKTKRMFHHINFLSFIDVIPYHGTFFRYNIYIVLFIKSYIVIKKDAMGYIDRFMHYLQATSTQEGRKEREVAEGIYVRFWFCVLQYGANAL